ncbi:alpha/beta hydrolase [Gammaproteobacteria bacterium]|jgi:alpha-beta hydrolase superfamily lysophospholipase|nr:alpha/beta hydrolase [Gammaproteobacteria bacterium]
MLKEYSNIDSVKTISLTNDEKTNGVVIISHGMAEHMGRYSWLINKLNNDGYHVIGHDHRGHGKWIENGYEEGIFHSSNGWNLVADDLINLIKFSHEKFPNQKHYLLAHSMGSYVALSAISNNLHLSGLILSGSSHISPVTLFIQRILIKIIVLIKGRDKKSNFLDSITMRTFNDKFKPTQTPNDWISTDKTNVEDYTNDPMCGFIASNGLWDDMASSFKSIYNKDHYSSSDHDLPILIISGDKDPVGEMGAGVNRLYEFLKSIFKNTSFILLKNERHEVFSGLDKNNTYLKLKSFLTDTKFTN